MHLLLSTVLFAAFTCAMLVTTFGSQMSFLLLFAYVVLAVLHET